MASSKILLLVLGAIFIIGGGVVLFGGSATPALDKNKVMESNTTHADSDVMVQKDTNQMPTDAAMMKGEVKSGTMIKGEMIGDTMVKKEDTMKATDTMMQKESVMMHSGSYIAYAPELVASSAAKGSVVLFFRAAWCPTCRNVDNDIKSHLKDIPSDLTILDVNYDDSAELKKKYGVTYQHTFVQVDASGALIKKWSGSPTLAALTAEVK